MNEFPKKLVKRLDGRVNTNSLRKLFVKNNLVDFSSNDYLGFSKSEIIFQKAHRFLIDNSLQQNGATGSRLLSGNHDLHEKVEAELAVFYKATSALVFNSGYDANIGFFSSVPQRGDIILYDELIHASIRDGIRLSNAKAFSFKHNDLEDLESKILRQAQNDSLSHDEQRSPSGVEASRKEIYIVTESVFSMDGDSPDLIAMAQLCKENSVHFIVDEAHAVGIFGENGCGLIQQLKLEEEVFARIITFGKGLGCHGAAILGSVQLKEYLINFARSFIYTTALPPHSLATILVAHLELKRTNEIQKLEKNIQFFKSEINRLNLQQHFIESNTAIHCCMISGNEKVKTIAQRFQEKGFDVKPILSPTVPKEQERLRICLHSYNTKEEIKEVLKLLTTFVN